MEVNDQNLQALGQYLGQTLDPALRREAEQFLQSVERNAGYPVLVLTLVAKEDVPEHIRFSAALLLKNFVRRHWSIVEGEDMIAKEDRQAIKANIVTVLVKVPTKIQLQLGEVIGIIADNDFPADWKDLVPELASKLTPRDYRVNNGILQTAHFLFKRWRSDFASDEVYAEIKYVIGIFGVPFLNLIKSTHQMISQYAQDATALPILIESMLLSTKVFHSLNAQDLPEFFEDNMAEFMHIFRAYLSYQNPLLQSDDANEAGPLERLRASICEIVEMYTKRFEEFLPLVPTFTDDIWAMLIQLSLDPKNDILVCRALSFIAAVVKGGSCQEKFSNAETLKEICRKLVLENMSMREVEEEMIEDEPIAFISRDLEGADSDTRRKAATDLVQALQEKFEQATSEIITSYISQFLQHYAENPANNWRDKDIAIFLLTSIATRTTTSHGAISTSQFVNVLEFFSQHILCDLQAPSASVHPLLQMDAIKFVNTFRHQLTKEQLLAIMPMLAERFSSEHVVVHTYAAICIERILAIKVDRMPIITSEDIKPYMTPLLANLFGHLEKSQSPEKLAENEFLMKAIMRLLMTARENVSDIISIVGKLVDVVNVISTNPSNPRFNHFTFEAIGVIIRNHPTALAQIEERTIPAYQSILERDVSEFIPYVLQLMAFSLERHTSIPSFYLSMLASFLQPLLWEQPGNVPALTRLIKAYVSKDVRGIIERNQIEPVLGIFQKLLSSRTNDHFGMELLEALFSSAPSGSLDKYMSAILGLMLNRLTSSRTEKFTNAFVSLIGFLMALDKFPQGPDSVIAAFDVVQPGLFANMAPAIIAKVLPKLPTGSSYKACAIGYTRLVTESMALQQPQMAKLWSDMLKAVASLFSPDRLEKQQAATANSNADDPTMELVESVGFQNTFSRLGSTVVPSPDLLAAVPDAAAYFAAQLKLFNVNHPGQIQNAAQQWDDPSTVQVVQAALASV